MLFTNNIDLQLSESTIRNMFLDAKIVFSKSKNTSTASRIDQHFCSATIKYVRYLNNMFSNETSIISADQKSLIKVETAGSMKGSTIQLLSEKQTVRCHDQCADIYGSIALYATETMQQDPSLYDFSNSEPIDKATHDKLGYIKITEEMIPGWSRETHTKFTEGLGVVFAHNNDIHGETGFVFYI